LVGACQEVEALSLLDGSRVGGMMESFRPFTLTNPPPAGTSSWKRCPGGRGSLPPEWTQNKMFVFSFFFCVLKGRRRRSRFPSLLAAPISRR
jgi:hypothetical protein